ncbi:MAG TPA: NFACT family protein [Fimbriimonadaceae bacterium]|nr:NFACT family protein [Fimbriimonadaceae bacterium]HRJ32876.1 NFACT family protein [Fimbriimonadaceae bacterium]
MKRIPFDSLCLRAVVDELQEWRGAKVQKVIVAHGLDLWLELYLRRPAWLVISADPLFARVHFSSSGPPAMASEASGFQQEARTWLRGLVLESVRQRGFDRILELDFARADQEVTLVAELMGKHSNLFLLAQGRLRAAAKWLGPSQTRRPIRPGALYEPPPIPLRPSLLEAREGDDLTEFEGASPFAIEWIESHGLDAFQRAARNREWSPGYLPGRGAYPLPIPDAIPALSFSDALQSALAPTVAKERLDRAKSEVLGPLRRTLRGRVAARAQIAEALDFASRARELQEEAELILAYQAQIPAGSPEVVVWDYAGEERRIRLDPSLSPVENAERRFRRAKKAKQGADQAREQDQALADQIRQLEICIHNLELAESLADVEIEKTHARARRWFQPQAAPTQIKSERPFEGHSVRETWSPAGWKILYGENATSNDYVTTKLAKPNDYWLHVRGGPGAHVVICTQNQPDRVQRADLMAAAVIAARNSPQKHSRHIPVDYCLKKYVRKPRGSAPGMVVYSHEKTLDVDSVPGLA